MSWYCSAGLLSFGVLALLVVWCWVRVRSQPLMPDSDFPSTLPQRREQGGKGGAR